MLILNLFCVSVCDCWIALLCIAMSVCLFSSWNMRTPATFVALLDLDNVTALRSLVASATNTEIGWSISRNNLHHFVKKKKKSEIFPSRQDGCWLWDEGKSRHRRIEPVTPWTGTLQPLVFLVQLSRFCTQNDKQQQHQKNCIVVGNVGRKCE